MTDKTGYRPLYQQVRDLFQTRIADGTWQAGGKLPSEQALARELDVSHGTVRKALDELAAQKLVERRQGTGTFVRAVTPERSVFQFLYYTRPGGDRLMPEVVDVRTCEDTANPLDRRQLRLAEGARVVRIDRLRGFGGATTLIERMALPLERFAGLAGRPLPNALYAMYHSDYRVLVSVVTEELRAVAAETGDAALLGVSPATPLLAIDRIAYDLDGIAVEWRQTLCLTRDVVYSVTQR
ncbi:GntR family transcriptional regulator [Stappia sp. MMSF_3263]|uniref:GntR family transcriptional regulator n=1 Tax=Stappia sp. MMSF_3263 TaxID=3046693 RepID=UPI00273F0C9D|nr:GntR family transcriptional regulator [Stappia sp. MMSF_3263]